MSDFMTPSLRLVGLDENHIKTPIDSRHEPRHLQCVIVPMPSEFPCRAPEGDGARNTVPNRADSGGTWSKEREKLFSR
jgi:hypothetical protein